MPAFRTCAARVPTYDEQQPYPIRLSLQAFHILTHTSTTHLYDSQELITLLQHYVQTDLNR